jgi:DUF1365 family protein
MFESLIFTGTVRHRRFTPKPHQFSYKLSMFCFDIGDLPNSFKDIKHVSIEQFNWFSFRRKNYLSHPEIPLDAYARQLVVAKFNTYPKGKIYLLTHLSCLGYCFNPISLYFIFDETNQQLDYLIIEVTNTPWGEKHNYVLETSVKPKNEVYRYQFQKELHVSPFMAMNYEYQFNLKLNKQKIIVHMENHLDGKKAFDVTLVLTALAQKETSFKKVFRHYPLDNLQSSCGYLLAGIKIMDEGFTVSRTS